MSTTRKCSVPGCGQYVPAADLMCRRHWARVPYPHRAWVARARADRARGMIEADHLAAIEARATATITAPAGAPGAPPANTTYSGVRITYGGRLVASAVTSAGEVFRPDRSRAVRDHSEEFEWGYSGSGPSQLALALVLDATASEVLAIASYQWFRAAAVGTWGPKWVITAGEIRQWVAQWEREQPADDVAQPQIVEGGGA